MQSMQSHAESCRVMQSNDFVQGRWDSLHIVARYGIYILQDAVSDTAIRLDTSCFSKFAPRRVSVSDTI